MRLIDADALMTWFDNHYDDEEVTVGFISGLIKEQQTIEPERKMGKWIDETFNALARVHHPYHPYKCDQCGEHSETNSNFCSNCGAMMTDAGIGK